jgi:DNA modification methylase
MNCLSEREWLRNQVPIWWFPAAELKTKFDMLSRKQHPAVFPSALAKRVIKNFTHENETVLDIFSGVGTTLFAAQNTHRNAIGFEIHKAFADFTNRRLRLVNDQVCPDITSTHRSTSPGQHIQQLNIDCRRVKDYIKPSSIDLVFTSPPYWDMLKQPPSARNLKNKKYLKKNYSNDPMDISNDTTLDQFKHHIKEIFKGVYDILGSGKRCIINTADYRRAGKYLSLSTIYISILKGLGFELKNVIIWDRRADYDIGIFSYPRNFIVNNGMFEYILEFMK